jgi:hypothetical protein
VCALQTSQQRQQAAMAEAMRNSRLLLLPQQQQRKLALAAAMQDSQLLLLVQQQQLVAAAHLKPLLAATQQRLPPAAQMQQQQLTARRRKVAELVARAGFGDFEEQNGWCGYVPSAASVIGLFITDSELPVAVACFRQLRVGGALWKGDHNYKFVKCVRNNGQMVYAAVFTLMNVSMSIGRWRGCITTALVNASSLPPASAAPWCAAPAALAWCHF